MQKLKLKITGVSPLLLHNGQTTDPLNSFTQKIKAISSKRKKVDADFEKLAELEWYAGLYTKKEKPCIPGMMVEATIREGAKKNKLGKIVQGSVFCYNDPILRFPDEDKSLEELWQNPEYRLTTKVRVQQSSVMRTRPKFDEWWLECVIDFDEEAMNRETLIDALNEAGTKGFGDWRPRFGRFVVELVE